MALQRPDNLWLQVVDDVRTRIASGEYAPGDKLPSEAQMITAFGVSRTVVRQGIAALRAEGLVTVQHGKGAWVREHREPAAALARPVARTGTGVRTRYAEPGPFAEAEEPSRYRTTTDDVTGPRLQLAAGEAAFGTDRLMVHGPTGARVLHRTVLPFAAADGTALEADPHQTPAAIYTALAAAGHALTWTEQTSARMPTPDEASALDAAEGVPLLVVRRITHGTAGPLLFEETRSAADRLYAEHHVTAESGRADA